MSEQNKSGRVGLVLFFLALVYVVSQVGPLATKPTQPTSTANATDISSGVAYTIFYDTNCGSPSVSSAMLTAAKVYAADNPARIQFLTNKIKNDMTANGFGNAGITVWCKLMAKTIMEANQNLPQSLRDNR